MLILFQRSLIASLCQVLNEVRGIQSEGDYNPTLKKMILF